ncbi:MAG TPA: hypothetical protein VM345_06820 [Acidimicrobiales bacterium]|jgi:hypothetical protein|nr:hypothetical protein [Acidimicrobiales bacterium]
MATDQRQPSVPLPGNERGSRSDKGDDRGDRGGRERGAANAATRAGRGAVVGALLIGLVLGALGYWLAMSISSEDPFAGRIDANRYQAVILSNDKVYFGRITDVSDTFFELDDAFFLRETRESEDAEPVRALLPVNRELHAPENRMLIRKDEVVLVENLASDSPVLEEIRRQKDE